MDEDLTVKDIINTMTTAQKNTLYLYIGIALGEKTVVKVPFADIKSFNENQKKVLYYLIGVALDKSLESDVLEIIKRQ